MNNKIISLKIDVDTERGTRIGVANLIKLFEKYNIKTTFLYSLGPDNTGRALKRIFRPGFLKKVSRTSVISTYGIRTLMNGVLLPGPHIGKKHAALMRASKKAGHEVGIHSYDHCDWQDNLFRWPTQKVFNKFQLALDAFKDIFNVDAFTAGTAGWQANENSLAAYDNANFLYGSDSRGTYPFIPKIGKKIFKTPQVPSTLPTLDELIGRPEYPTMEKITKHLFHLCEQNNHPNVFTIHAELEGIVYFNWLENFIATALEKGYQFMPTEKILNHYVAENNLPVCEFVQGEVDGRSGKLALQGETFKESIPA